MSIHHIKCEKCLNESDFYINQDNILFDFHKAFKPNQKFFSVTICPWCDEVYLLKSYVNGP